MRMDEYAALDGIGLATMIRRRETCQAEVVTVARAAAEALSPINAVVDLVEEDSGLAEGEPAQLAPFPGVPMLVKDGGHGFAGILDERGSRALKGMMSRADSELAGRFRTAGVVPIGRSNAPEFAMSATTEPVLHGPCLNPWNPDFSAGGSSGGAAAAVAAGIVPVAHASDGAGSIRIPAAMCGVVGLKPSRGRIPRPTGRELDLRGGRTCDFIVSRTVRDSAAMLRALAGPTRGDFIPLIEAEPMRRREVDRRKLRLALCLELPGATRPDRVSREIASRAADICEALGHRVILGTPNVDIEPMRHACSASLRADWALRLEEFEAAGLPIDLSLLEPATRSSVLSGREVSAVELGRCYRYFTDLSKRMALFFESFDILVMPTLTKPPFKLGELSPKGEEDCLRVFHDTWDLIEPLNLANIGGHPAMSLPLGETEEGLPVGVELSAAFGREDLLLALAFQLEEATRWQRRQPLHHVSSVRSS